MTYHSALSALDNLIYSRASLDDKCLPAQKLARMNTFVDLLGIPLRKMPIIHIAGTKGKGSTCAFLESILQKHNISTGVFTSPHLVHVNERFRINSKPVSNDLFSYYFWKCYPILMPFEPRFFSFLMAMAIQMFYEEEVDVVIFEVGIGGAFDDTNIVFPTVCGVTSLGHDHQTVLGYTLKEIASHKAGIFKEGVKAYTVPQPPEAMEVLRDTARRLSIPLLLTPPLHSLLPPSSPPLPLGIPGEHQSTNAALAVMLAREFLWLRSKGRETCEKREREREREREGEGEGEERKEEEELSREEKSGLESGYLPGRCRVVRVEERGERVLLDGAHTVESMLTSAQWLEKELNPKANSSRVLLFSCTGGRSAQHLLRHFARLSHTLPFTRVFFIANHHSTPQGSFSSSILHPMAEVEEWLRDWNGLKSEYGREDGVGVIVLSVAEAFAELRRLREEDERLTGKEGGGGGEVEHEVCVMGSLVLVGSVYKFLGTPLYGNPSSPNDFTFRPLNFTSWPVSSFGVGGLLCKTPS